jgi:hypothetical protein
MCNIKNVRFSGDLEYYYIYYKSDSGIILEDGDARTASIQERRASGYLHTIDLIFRLYRKPLDKGGCGSCWEVFQKKIDEIEEPCWSLVGQHWGSLYGKNQRLEEVEYYSAVRIQNFFYYVCFKKKLILKI